MSRRVVKTWAVLLSILMLASGCHPMQPHYFLEDGDLSHYLDVATHIEEPDVHQAPLEEAAAAKEPLTLETFDTAERWYLSLEEVLHHTLANSQVMRTTGARVVQSSRPFFTTINDRSSTILTRQVGGPAQGIVTSFDPAIVESGNGFGNGSPLAGVGVEAALAEFDASFFAELEGRNVHRANNSPPFGAIVNGIPNRSTNAFTNEDQADFAVGLRKQTATGGSFELRHGDNYSFDKNPNIPNTQALRQFYTADLTASFSHPLLQGAGAQYNRIAGFFGFDQFVARSPISYDGVVIARIRHDISLAEFESQLQDLVQETETAYWDLYFAYREFQTRQDAFHEMQRLWKLIQEREDVTAPQLNQANAQFFLFRSELETALAELLGLENRLRFLMGISPADRRLIVPMDEPVTGAVKFDWHQILPESLTRRPEVRKQKWLIQRRELELIASRNHLLPRLDLTGSYRFNGSGEELISSNRSGLQHFQPGSNAFENLTGGELQEWNLGLQLDVPIGFRNALSGVRHQELLLSRERAILEDLELEISHQLSESIRILNSQYRVTQTNLNRRRWAIEETRANNNAYREGAIRGPAFFDTLLGSQRREVDAKIAYHRSLVDYNVAIMRVHYRKGSLLEFNNVLLAEGPWPKKAYFDALREARKRDSGLYLDYGFTRPSVFGRGPVPQHTGTVEMPHEVYEHPRLMLEPPAEEVPAREAVEPPLPGAGGGPESGPLDSGDSLVPEPPAVDRSSHRRPRNNDGPQLLNPKVARAARPVESRPSWRQSPATSGGRVHKAGGQAAAARRGVRQLSFEQFSAQQRHEPVANQPTSASAQPAAGWTRAQR